MFIFIHLQDQKRINCKEMSNEVISWLFVPVQLCGLDEAQSVGIAWREEHDVGRDELVALHPDHIAHLRGKEKKVEFWKTTFWVVENSDCIYLESCFLGKLDYSRMCLSWYKLDSLRKDWTILDLSRKRHYIDHGGKERYELGKSDFYGHFFSFQFRRLRQGCHSFSLKWDFSRVDLRNQSLPLSLEYYFTKLFWLWSLV